MKRIEIEKLLISVILSVLFVLGVIYFFPRLYFFIKPEAEWWTALSVIATISLGMIAVSITVLLREKESKTMIIKLEKQLNDLRNEINKDISDSATKLEKRIDENKLLYENAIIVISNILDVQNVTENQSFDIWDNIDKKIDKVKKLGVLQSVTLQTWSIMAWKQGHLDITKRLREKAFEIDSKDFKNRVMLCSILTHDTLPDKRRIENIFNKTDIDSELITDNEVEYFYNLKGKFYMRIGEYKKAADCFLESVRLNKTTWSYKGYLLSLIMDNNVENKNIEKEIERLSNIPNSKWLDDSVLSQKSFRLFVNAFLDRKEIDLYYKNLTPVTIAEITYVYNNEYVKFHFFNFLAAIRKKYNDSDLELLYLTHYKLFGADDTDAKKEVIDNKVIEHMNKIITAHNMV